MKILLIFFLSLNIFSECFVKEVICINNNRLQNDYELVNKTCYFSQMNNDSSEMIKFKKFFQYLVIKNSTMDIKNTYNFSKSESHKSNYAPYTIKFKRNKFLLKNLKNKSRYHIPLSDSTCSIINYIEAIPGH